MVAAKTARWLTLEEARDYLNIGRNSIYDMASRGEIPGAVRVGTAWRVKPLVFFEAMGLPLPAEYRSQEAAVMHKKPLVSKFFKLVG